jgi:hypothetical protein
MNREKYQKIQEQLLLEYQKSFGYKIHSSIQEIGLTFDVEKLKKEIFSLLLTQKYGYKNISLRLTENDDSWDDQEKALTESAFSTQCVDSDLTDRIMEPEKYIKWHPGLPVNSYVSDVSKKIEEYLGLNVFKVSLRWMTPQEKYRLHADIEPCRIHIPLITNDRVWFMAEEKIHKMRYGKAYHLLPTIEHAVINYGSTPRLHLIFSTYLKNEIMKKMLELADVDVVQENLFSSVEKDSGIDMQSLAYLLKIDKDSTEEQRKFGPEVIEVIKTYLTTK